MHKTKADAINGTLLWVTVLNLRLETQTIIKMTKKMRLARLERSQIRPEEVNNTMKTPVIIRLRAGTRVFLFRWEKIFGNVPSFDIEKASRDAPNRAAFKADEVDNKPPKPNMIPPRLPKKFAAASAKGAPLSPSPL
jgi:hypothetical protein